MVDGGAPHEDVMGRYLRQQVGGNDLVGRKESDQCGHGFSRGRTGVAEHGVQAAVEHRIASREGHQEPRPVDRPKRDGVLIYTLLLQRDGLPAQFVPRPGRFGEPAGGQALGVVVHHHQLHVRRDPLDVAAHRPEIHALDVACVEIGAPGNARVERLHVARRHDERWRLLGQEDHVGRRPAAGGGHLNLRVHLGRRRGNHLHGNPAAICKRLQQCLIGRDPPGGREKRDGL